MSTTALPDTPVISVVIPVRNEGNRLTSAIASIVGGRSCKFPLQIVLVDDCSSDDCCRGFAEIYSWPKDYVRIDVVCLPRWSGIPFARNAGAAASVGSVLFITDANVVFPRNWDRPIRERTSENRVLCATIGDIDSTFRGYGCTLMIPSMGVSWIRDPRQHGGHVPVAPCAGTILSSELFRKSGGYDTAMPVYGAAEPEFSVRLWLLGADIVALPDLVLKHRFKPAHERQPFLDAIGRIQFCNYLRFGMLYLDHPRLTQMLRHYQHQSPSFFADALPRIVAGDVWHRRELLEKRLPLRFKSFVERFSLRDAFGQLAHG